MPVTLKALINSRKRWNELSKEEKKTAKAADFDAASWNELVTQEETFKVEGTFFEAWEKAAKTRTPVSETMKVGEIQAFAKIMKDIKEGTFDINKSMEAGLSLLAKEDSIRIDISSRLGASDEVLWDMVDSINQGSLDLAQFNLGAVELTENLLSMTKEIGRNLNIPQEALNRVTLLTSKLEGFDGAKFAAAFDTIGYSMETAIGAIDDMETPLGEIYTTAFDLGVVSEKFLGSVVDNLNLANTFGFDKGVRGLAEMVAKGQKLGLGMEKVTGLAEKFFDPESAIDFAANMQMIGGAVGDLTDPFKLMYMATNDLEGLQDAIIDTAAAAVKFDKEKGRFTISPDMRRQLKAQAEQMGMSYQEIADMAIQSARRAKVFEELKFMDMSDEDKELVSSMAQIGADGAIQIKVPGMEDLQDITELDTDQIKLLRKDNRTDSDLYKQQLTVADATGQSIRAIEAMMRIQMQQAGVGAGQIQTMGYSQQIAKEQQAIFDIDADTLKLINEGNFEELELQNEALFNKLSDLGLLEAEDIILRPGMRPIKPADDDTIIATKAPVSVATDEDGSSKSISILENISRMTEERTVLRPSEITLNGTLTLESDGNVGEVDVRRFFDRLNASNLENLKLKLAQV